MLKKEQLINSRIEQLNKTNERELNKKGGKKHK